MTQAKLDSPQQCAAKAEFVCRLTKRIQGRAAQIPTAGEIQLENMSARAIEIEIRTSPLQYLNLIVTDPTGQVVSESFYGDFFSPLAQSYPLQLLPGQRYVGPVSLLANVPEKKLIPGQYLVRAIYQYQSLKAVSNSLLVELPGNSSPAN